MERLNYTLRFNTPAFLGNAEQNAQWRTPPIKALLRQWWRVAYAADLGFRVNLGEMRRDEGLLFGHAWLDDDRDGRGQKVAARKGLVRIRLDQWGMGALKKAQWPVDVSVIHPEVTNGQGNPTPVGSALYQGFGPLVYDNRRRSSTLKANAAIQDGESATLALAVPSGHEDPELSRILRANTPRVEKALILMDRYGTLGGRSRNGWGSFNLLPSPSGERSVLPLRPWRDALTLDWPHALGLDDQGALIWQTAPAGDWKALMRELAIIKIGLRTQFMFNSGNNATTPEARHWLSHPVTKHNVGPWKQGRLPNSLRFKVRPAPEDPGKLVGVIFHVPCLPPPEFGPDRAAITRVWQSVHALLDELGKPPTARGYASIADPGRQARLRPQLDSVTLKRIPE